MTKSVKLIDLNKTKLSKFNARYVGCLVLTKDRQVPLQQPGHDFVTCLDYLCEFGGRIEEDE